jgi:hypothetical protein
MKLVFGLMAGVVFLALPATAQAEHHRICLVYEDLNPWDASTRFFGGEAGEDHGRRTPAGDPWTLLQFVPDHMLVRIADAKDIETLWGWEPVGSDGCTGIFDAEDAVTVEWVNWSYWPETDNSIATGRCNAQDCGVKRDFRIRALPAGQHDIVFPLKAKPEDLILWAASNAEGRASYNQGVTIFGIYWSGSDPALDAFPGASMAPLVGGSPTMLFKGPSLHSKYTVSHEYGHAVTMATIASQFVPGQVDGCFDPDPNDVPPPYSCAQHAWDSPEWQSVAILEGFADFYSIAAWNDFPGEGYRGIPNGWAGFSDIWATSDSPDSFYVSDFCSSVHHCEPGVANERDWTYFLWDIVQAGVLTLPETMDLLEGFHPTWPLADSATDATWQAFRSHVAPMLSPTDLAAWDDLAALRGVDN